MRGYLLETVDSLCGFFVPSLVFPISFTTKSGLIFAGKP
jgi:hypothetical protein